MVLLHRLDFVGDRGDDAVADLVEDVEGPADQTLEGLGPDDPGGPRLRQLDADDDAAVALPDGAAGDVVDVEAAGCLVGSDTALSEGEHRAARDDEEVPELGQAGDDVLR